MPLCAELRAVGLVAGLDLLAAAGAEPLQLRVVHINPKVLRAGRMVTMRLEGAGLTRVSAVAIYSGGAVDARFRVGAIERASTAPPE